MNSKVKNLFFTGALLIALFFVTGVYAQSTTTTSTTSSSKTYVITKDVFPRVTIGLLGGIMFPIADFSDDYKQGGVGGIDVGVRINKEVGIFLNAKYMNVPDQNTDIKAGRQIEITAGPRYYFTKPNLKSLFFLEAGLGAYIFQQDANTDPVNPSNNRLEKSNTNFGANVGPGFSLYLTPNLNIIVKGKYHVVFTKGYTTNFVTTTVGLDIDF